MTDLSDMAEEAELFFDSLPEELRRKIGARRWRDLHPFTRDDIMRALRFTYGIPRARPITFTTEAPTDAG